jgi:hypothetical protein
MQKDETEQLTSSLNNRAMLFLELNNFNTALSLLHQANYILKNKKQTEQIAQLKCTTLNNLGCVYKRLEKPKKALFFLNEALLLASRFSPSIDASSVHLNISSIKSSQSAHEEALFHALCSLKQCSSNFSDLKISALLSSYYQSGCEYQFLHKGKEAKRYFQQGFDLAHKHLGKSHQVTLKFFKSLHDKSLRDTPAIKKVVLKPIIERVAKVAKVEKLEKPFKGRTQVRSTEPRNQFKISHSSTNQSPSVRKINKSGTSSSERLFNDRVHNQITFIGNALGTMQKKIEKYSDKFKIEEENRFHTSSSRSTRKNFMSRLRAALIVQKTLKMWKDRKKFLEFKKNIVFIQRKYRNWKRNQKILKKKGNREVCNFSQQFYFRNPIFSMKSCECQTEFQSLTQTSEFFYPQVKKLNFFRSLIFLQREVKKFLIRKKRNRAALVIQKYCRRYLVRKKFFGIVKVLKPFLRKKRKALTMMEKPGHGEITFKSTKRWSRVRNIE